MITNEFLYLGSTSSTEGQSSAMRYMEKSSLNVDLDLCTLGMYHRHFSPWKRQMKHLHEACTITRSSAQLMPSLTALT